MKSWIRASTFTQSLLGLFMVLLVVTDTKLDLWETCPRFSVIWTSWREKKYHSANTLAKHTPRILFFRLFFTAHYLPPLTTLSLGSVSGTDKARQKAFIPCDATFTGDMNKQLLMNRLLTFPQTAASTASPPSSTLHIPAPSHQSSTPLFPFHILFLTLRHASCVTQMGT